MKSSTSLGLLELLKLQADALHRASRQIQDHQLDNALNLLVQCRSKVVLTGVGKSGIIAQKIAATLTSVGTLAIALHPCDALHGDIGIVTRDDVVIMISNSGETEELLTMLPHLKRRDVPIVAILGNTQSTLARQAHVILDASVDREACPLNLAPTASTTVALAIGDALAMTVMQMKGLTPEDFAINHPAGRLGKRLTLQVADLMHSSENVPALPANAPWLAIVLAIGEGGMGAINIIDSQRQLVGLITDGDIRRAVRDINTTRLNEVTAREIMTYNPVVVTPKTLAFDALKLMEERESQIAVLPVVDANNCCIGLIRLHDIIRNGL